MDWMLAIGEFWLSRLGWLAGLALLFCIIGGLMPCNPGMYWWKDLRAVATDFVYWFIVPLFLRICRTLMLIAGVVLFFGGREPQFLPVQQLPLWQQCLGILLTQDILLYALHRIFHTHWAWSFHAIHHSPTVLDWMSTTRFHPVNNLLTFSVADVAVLLLGFSPAALIVLAPFNTLYSALVHANLNWTFGPFRYVFASPVFHRWHHTTREEGLNKNFASTFPILDVVFGTFYMPAGRLPDQFGIGDPEFPESFWGQFLHPFRRKTSVGAGSGGSAITGWIRRRPVAAALMAMGVMVAVGLLSRAVYVTAQLAARNEQLATEIEQARSHQLQAQTAQHAFQLELARRAWAENDLVRATALLDESDRSFPQTAEQRQLHDLCQRKCLSLTGHMGAVLSVAISADGQRLVSGGEDGSVKVWDAATRQAQLTLTGHTGPVYSVALSPDGHHLVSGSKDKTLRVWDLPAGQLKLTLTGHTGAVLSVAISADGQRVVSGSADLSVRVWDTTTGHELPTLTGDRGAAPVVAMSADGRRIVSARSWTAKLWDAQTGQEQFVLAGHTDLVYGVALSPDGQRLVSGSFDKRVKMWDALTGQAQLTLTGHAGPVYSVALSADGKRIISGSKDQTVKVWDTATGQATLTLKGHTDSVTSVAISADGKRIVSSSRDGTIKVWDAEKCAVHEPADLARQD
jgi:sterol desaturase/sphingolipid hydroxylase (fatty acid hydroxylase superfamily)